MLRKYRDDKIAAFVERTVNRISRHIHDLIVIVGVYSSLKMIEVAEWKLCELNRLRRVCYWSGFSLLAFHIGFTCLFKMYVV